MKAGVDEDFEFAPLPNAAATGVVTIEHTKRHTAIDASIRLSFDRGEWTDATKDALRALWPMGWSATAIGKYLGFTKNGIVGKVHRLDLTGRPSPIDRSHGPRAPKAPPAPAQTLPALPSMTTNPPPPAIPRAPDARPRPSRAFRAPVPPPAPPVVLAAPRLSAKCQFPLWGDHDRPTHKYCDAPVPLGDSWCVPCRKRVFSRGVQATA